MSCCSCVFIYLCCMWTLLESIGIKSSLHFGYTACIQVNGQYTLIYNSIQHIYTSVYKSEMDHAQNAAVAILAQKSVQANRT